jgi:hypothetical protein
MCADSDFVKYTENRNRFKCNYRNITTFFWDRESKTLHAS